MPESYPYIISNNKIGPILSRVRSAQKPSRFTLDTLTKWGFTASNDRAMLRILKSLGFLSENGAPTEHYDRLRDPNDWQYVLGERVRELYSDLFAIDAKLHSAAESEVKGAMSRVTGKDEETVKRYYATFKSLANLGKFEPKQPKTGSEDIAPETGGDEDTPAEAAAGVKLLGLNVAGFHYNIQLHLPATTDIGVYNAIFKSLREHLGT